MIIDGMMHLEVEGDYWDGLEEGIIQQYDALGIDKGVVGTTSLPSRQANDRTLAAYRKHPDHFIPFGHLRPADDWEAELARLAEWGWRGLMLHERDLRPGGADAAATTAAIAQKAADVGIGLVQLHLVDYEAVDQLARQLPQVTWILPSMGCWERWQDLEQFCKLAGDRDNVYLGTSGVMRQWVKFNLAAGWAGADKITFASGGYQGSPLVEMAKVEAMRLTDSWKGAVVTDEQLSLILGGNMARLLGLADDCGKEAR